MTPSASPSARPTNRLAPSGYDDVAAALERLVDERAAWMVDLRRQLHANPEASGQEMQTTQFVADVLRKNGLQPRIMGDGLGVMVDLDAGAPATAPRIALRAELDCVKVDDDKRVPYASQNCGLCHACGHDAHTTIVLTAALALHESGAQLGALNLQHNFRFIFQPSEESAHGARSMIEQGAVKNVAAILAVHVDPFIEAGTIGLRKGPLTSACVAFEVTIKGRSGHSARPFQAIDPIPAAANIVDLFNQLCPRSMDSRYPLALCVTSINAGDSFNVIPDDAMLKGTLRAARVEDLDAVKQRMHAIVGGVALATGCEIALEFPFYAPPTNNDHALIDTMALAAAALNPSQGALWIDVPSLGAEDFAFFQEVIPGAIVRLGAAMPESQRHPLHSSLFDINEAALPFGAKFLTRAALLAAMTPVRVGGARE